MPRFLNCLFRRGVEEDSGLATAESSAVDDDAPPAYRITVDGYETARRGRHIVYTLTVSRGNANWPLRRRFQQVVSLHGQLIQGLGRSAMRQGLPRLPPRVTPRSLCCGRYDERFLAARALRLQRYLEELVRFIPYVDQCEALREFLCSVDVSAMSYDALLDLGQAIGRGGGPQGVEASAIASLPRRSPEAWVSASSESRCVICQDIMVGDEDIRTLPCGHEYHYTCIAQWLAQSNTCCVCQGLAVPPSQESPSGRK